MNLHKHRERTHGALNDPDLRHYTTIMIQEPYWTDYEPWKGCPQHHSWTRYEPKQNDPNTPPRAVTYVNKTQIPPAYISQIHTPISDIVILRIAPPKTTPTILVNVYNPCDTSIILQLHDILKKVEANNKGAEFILAGDFNCHHPLWNPTQYLRHDETADQLIDLATDLNLSLLIPPGTITYESGEAATAIDLAWGSSTIERRVLKCRIAEESDQGSDHRPIETIIAAKWNLQQNKEGPAQLDIARTDWDKFTASLKSRLPALNAKFKVTTAHDLDNSVRMLSSVIQKALRDSTPTKRSCPHPKRWWSKNLTRLRRRAAKLRNRHRHANNPHIRAALRNIWREAANEYTTAIRKAKESTWREFVENCDGKSIWDVKRYISNSAAFSNIPTLNDGQAETFEQMTQVFRKEFFPEPPAANLSDINTTIYPREVNYNPIITPEQIQKAVGKVHPNKAPGPDGITNRVLQKALPEIEKYLLAIMQASLDLSHFPTPLKHTATVVLRKPAKPDYTKSKAYRPIALENTIGKILESVVAETLSYLTEQHGLLPKNHFGGRPGRSTEDALTILSENIYKAWKKKKVYSAVFLDVAGAFNYVHHRRLAHNLRQREIPHVLVKWLQSFLTGRSTQLHFNGEKTETVNIPAGVPQGSPLSPLLYMFYNADLLQVGHNPNKDLAMGFIDDVVYGTTGRSDVSNARRLKEMLAEAEKWKFKHGAKFEESKYILVHFTRNKRQTTNASISIAGTTIKPTDEARYLGVIFDKELRFKTHVQYAVKKGTSAALALSSIGRTTWGASHQQIRQLFESTVATRMDYGAIVWHRPDAKGQTQHSAAMRKFTTVQRIGMIGVLGCYRTTPTLALEIDSDLQPSWLRLQTKVLSSYTRFKSLPHRHPVKTRIRNARSNVKSTAKLTHVSNLENIYLQFPKLAKEKIAKVQPFTKAPWETTHTTEEQTTEDQEDPVATKKSQRAKIKKLAQDRWKEDYSTKELDKAKNFRKIVDREGNEKGVKFYKGFKNRKDAALMAQLRTEHCGLNGYLQRVNKVENAECERCNEGQNETVSHYLLECKGYEEERRRLESKVGKESMELEILLGTAKMAKETLIYIEETKRFGGEQV
jgi:hypothetical protein